MNEKELVKMNNKNIKIKTFATFNTKTLDEKVNEFTNREDIEVIEIKPLPIGYTYQQQLYTNKMVKGNYQNE